MTLGSLTSLSFIIVSAERSGACQYLIYGVILRTFAGGILALYFVCLLKYVCDMGCVGRGEGGLKKILPPFVSVLDTIVKVSLHVCLTALS